MNAGRDVDPWDRDASRDERDERDITQLRVPPHSIEAESSVLGSLLLNGAAWDRVGDVLVEADFYRYEHRLVFAAVRDLVNANKPADVLTVLEYLERDGKDDDVGGLAYLNSLAQGVPTAAHVRRYAEIVRERAVLRRLVTAGDEIATLAFAPGHRTVDAILDAAQGKVFAIGEERIGARDEWQSSEDGMLAVLERIQAQADGEGDKGYIPTGLADLDEKLDGGLRGGELVAVGARPRMGKSALALTIAKNIARNQGLPTGFFTMEMPAVQLHTRALSMESHIHLSRLRRPERLREYDWPAITSAVELLRVTPLHVSAASSLTIHQLRARARALQRRVGKLGCLVVDYLGLMSGTDPKVPRAYQLEEVTKGLKALAKELDIPVLLLVQINRKVEEREDQMPTLADIRDAGSVEQDADIVMFLHREFMVRKGLGDEWRYYAAASVAKLRDGEPGLIDLMYVGENVRFLDWAKETPAPVSKVRTRGGGAAL